MTVVAAAMLLVRFYRWHFGILDHPLSPMMTAGGVAHRAARSVVRLRPVNCYGFKFQTTHRA
jgi:hypothetical protein